MAVSRIPPSQIGRARSRDLRECECVLCRVRVWRLVRQQCRGTQSPIPGVVRSAGTEGAIRMQRYEVQHSKELVLICNNGASGTVCQLVLLDGSEPPPVTG